MFAFIIGFVLGAVAGALFARRNGSKVDAAVEKAKEVKASAEQKLQK